MNNNVLCPVRFNGQAVNGMAATFSLEDGEEWMTISCDVEVEPNVGHTMSMRVKDLRRLLRVDGT